MGGGCKGQGSTFSSGLSVGLAHLLLGRVAWRGEGEGRVRQSKRGTPKTNSLTLSRLS